MMDKGKVLMLDLVTLVKICAPQVEPSTMLAVIKTESRGQPFIINDNSIKKSFVFNDKNKAIEFSYSLIQKKHNLDFGLTQINLKNAQKYHLTLNRVFDPCENIKYGGLILTNAYLKNSKNNGEQVALLKSFSVYNTGNTHKGFTNGYVGKVVNNATVIQIPPHKQEQK